MTKFYKVVRAIVLPFTKLLYPYTIINPEKMNVEGGFILAANHTSILDVFFLVLAFKKRMIRFMAKEELFKNPIVRWFVTNMGAFAVRRGKGDKESINTAINLIKDGQIMGIFPEGTRSKDGKPLRAKSGVALISATCEADILPVHIIPQTKSGRMKLFHRTYVVFGDLIKFEELGIVNKVPSEFKNASRFIMDKIVGITEK